MKNVAIYESSSCWGGTAKYVSTLVDNLDSSRFRVTLFIDAVDGYYKNPKVAANIVVHKNFRLIDSDKLFIKLLNVFFIFANVPYHFWQLLLNRIDVVHTNNDILKHIPVLIAARLLNKFVICHVHDHRELTVLERVAIKMVDRLVVLTVAAKKLYGAYYNPEQIVAIHNGIVVEDRPLVTFDFSINSPSVAVVGRLEEWKGQEIFLRSLPLVMARVPTVTYYVVGDSKGCDDSYKKRLLKLVSELNIGDNVQFLGWVEGAEQLMGKFDLTVCSSISPEPFGFVVIESLLAGTPVVATRHGGPCEVIIDGLNGYLYEPLDVEGLAALIVRLLSNLEALKVMGENGKQHVVENFTLEKNILAIEALYESR